MTSALVLDPQFGRVLDAEETFAPAWLADELISADGLTAITGASKTGKTTLAIDAIRALRDPKSHQGLILESWISKTVNRVMVIATHGQHGQYAQAFHGDPDIGIIEVIAAPPAGFWRGYADAAAAYGADLVVVDTVQSLAGSATPENLDGLLGFACPTIGVFVGYASSAGVVGGDEYRALAVSSIHLKQDPEDFGPDGRHRLSMDGRSQGRPVRAPVRSRLNRVGRAPVLTGCT